MKSLLLGFTHLKRIDLGVLPTSNPRAYGSLKTELENKGVGVEWECCISDHGCTLCGSFHDLD